MTRRINELLDVKTDEERQTEASIIKLIQAEFRVHNMTLPPAEALRVPGRGRITSAIRRIAPSDHAIRTRGRQAAYRDMHAVGVGVTTSRPLERVEMDEYLFDAFTLFKQTGVLNILPEEICTGLNLHGQASRLSVSLAIDVHTRCILALKIGRPGESVTFCETLEMICTPKDRLFDGIVELDWPMYGKPESIVLDRGSGYIADASYDLMQSLGIMNVGAVAGMPWLRGTVESAFRTMHKTLAVRFPARTFSNPVQKGENQPDLNARATFEDVLEWIVRWAVDLYHTTPHSGLHGRTPYEAWQTAVAMAPPAKAPRSLLCKVFGVELKRKLNSRGLHVLGVQYGCPELYNLYSAGVAKQKLELRYWPNDISAIEVKVAHGQWLSVPVIDPKYKGMTAIELHALHVAARGEGSEALKDVNARAEVSLDRDISKRKRAKENTLRIAVAGITAAHIDSWEEKAQRYMDSTVQRAWRGEPMDMFESEVPSLDGAGPEAVVLPVSVKDVPSDDDLME